MNYKCSSKRSELCADSRRTSYEKGRGDNYSEKAERWCWDTFRGGDDSLGQVTFSHPAISSVPVQNDNGSPMAAQSDIHARTQTDSARPRCAAAAMGCCETSQTQVSNLPSFLLLLLLLFVSIHPLLFSIFFLSWLWWGLFLCKTSPSDLFERPAHVILPDHHCMTCFYIRLTKELFDQGVWCVIVRNSASRWQPLFPKAAPWPHSIQGKTPLEWPLFIE